MNEQLWNFIMIKKKKKISAKQILATLPPKSLKLSIRSYGLQVTVEWWYNPWTYFV